MTERQKIKIVVRERKRERESMASKQLEERDMREIMKKNTREKMKRKDSK